VLTEEDTLTREQRAVVDASLDGPFIVDAGAGTGKTYTLVRRAVRLIEESVLTPSELLVVTFTNKAANEIGVRLTGALAKIHVYELPACGTFHGIAAALLNEFAYVTGDSPDLRTIDDPRARAVFRKAYDELLAGKLGVDVSALPMLDREDVLVRDLASLAMSLKNRGTTVDAFEREALAAVPYLRTIPFGQIFTPGSRTPRKDPRPEPARTPDERAAEADREERNVRAVAAMFRRFDALLAGEGLLTYGDLLMRSVAMLNDFPAIAERLRRRWRHALVDEFQDTNPQQLAFIRAIFGEDLRPVMAVGDVRQAIYEWNGADPLGIVKLAQRPGTTVFPLTQNRRSFQEILDIAHRVLPVEGPGATKEALNALAGPASHPAVRHAVFSDGDDTAACRESEARAIAAEIAALAADGVQPRDIAILLRSRPAARTYAKALRDRGIASRTYGGVGFFDAPEIVDAVSWFRLALDPSERAALARIMESPAIGFSDGTVAKLFSETRDTLDIVAGTLPAWLHADETRRIERLRATLSIVSRSLSLPLADAVRTVLRETAVDAAQIAWNPDAAAQIEANVAKLVSLAEGFAKDRPLARLGDFVAEIDERAELEDDESEAELSGDEVAIMTIHAAKGLEWEHVFIANVSPQTFPNSRGDRGETVVQDPRTKALAFAFGADGMRPLRWFLREEHDPLTGQRFEKKKNSERAEERRLFYVALTRAKRSVWISGVRPSAKGSMFLEEILAYVADRNACRAFPTPDDVGRNANTRLVTDARPSQLADVGRLESRLARQPSLFEPWRGKLSYTAISTFRTCPRQARYRYALQVPDFRETPDVELADFDEPAGYRRTIDSATYGNIVHRVLEWAARAGIDGRSYQLETLVDDALAEFESDGDASLRDRVTTAAGRSLDVLSEYTPVGAEVEFDTTIAGTSVGGFVDLVARDRAGDIWIVDYKTGRIPDDAFALQLALYRIALREKYPHARLAILRIADHGVSLIEPPIPPDATVEQIVRAAAPMDRDEAHTGVQCGTCPYAGRLCPEGEAALR